MTRNDDRPAQSTNQAVIEAALEAEEAASRATQQDVDGCPTPVTYQTAATQTTAEPMRQLTEEILQELKRELEGDKRCEDSITHCLTVISRVMKERVRIHVRKHPPPQAAVQTPPPTAVSNQPQPQAVVYQPPSTAEDTDSWDSGSYGSWEQDRQSQVDRSDAMGKSDAERQERKIETWIQQGTNMVSRGLPISKPPRRPTCPYCDGDFQTILELFTHQDTQHRRRVYSCQTCPHFSRDGLSHTMHHRRAHGCVKQAACRRLDRVTYGIIDDVVCYKSRDLISTLWPADSATLRTKAEAAIKDVDSPLYRCRWN